MIQQKPHIRHVVEDELNQEEIGELKEIKNTTLSVEYEYIILATHKKKLISKHFHLHIIVT
jgi:hypothetical protein